MIFNTAIIALALSISASALPQTYPNKCGDQVCPADKAKCCEVIVNGVAEIGCFAVCPPVQALQARQANPTTSAPPSTPTFGPKCGDSFFCPVGKVCCPNALYHCADPGKESQECPPLQTLQARQTYPNKCGDQVCPADKAKCCEVIVNGVAEIGCFAVCPPVQALQARQANPTTSAPPSTPTFGPKCGDSFFCPVGKVCCPNALYHCADPGKESQQCPQ